MAVVTVDFITSCYFNHASIFSFSILLQYITSFYQIYSVHLYHYNATCVKMHELVLFVHLLYIVSLY